MLTNPKNKSNLLSIFMIMLFVFALNIISVQPALAAGGNPVDFQGYRYVDNHTIQVWIDKNNNALYTTDYNNSFKVYNGTDITGTPMGISGIETIAGSSATANVYPASNAGNWKITTTDELVPGNTYTVVVNSTIRANNGLTLGTFNNCKDVVFSFTVPSFAGNSFTTPVASTYTPCNLSGTYAAGTPGILNSWQANNSTNVTVEGNVGFTLNIPAINDVSTSMSLKRYDPSSLTWITVVPGTDLFAPVATYDHTSFFYYTATNAGSKRLLYDTTYKLEIPDIALINGETIPARTITFTTVPAIDDITATYFAATAVPTASVVGSDLNITWTALSGVTGYNVYASTDKYWNFVKLNTDGPVTTTTYIPSSLTPNTNYYFRVTPLMHSAEGGFSSPVSATTPTVMVTGVTLDKTTDSITAGGTDQLTATIAPTNATNQNVTWSSDNAAIATVSSTGLVTAVSAGTANVTVTTEDGGKTATCIVTVMMPDQSAASVTPIGTKAAGAGFNISITGAKDTSGTLLSGSKAVTVTNGAAVLFSGTPTFTDGAATVSIPSSSTPNSITTTGTYSLTVSIEGVTPQPTASLTITASTSINATMSTAVIDQALSKGATRTITVTLYDNFGNRMANLSRPMRITILVANNDPTTAEAYIVDGTSYTAASTVTPANVNVPLDANGQYTKQVVMPSVIDPGDGVSVRITQNNGSSYIGSPFTYYESYLTPAVSSAATSDATHIVLTMDRPLVGTLADANAFSITGAASNPTVTGAVVSGSSVTLTLSAPIVYGEIITVSYAKTGTNNLTNGSETANFSGLAVTNNVPSTAASPTFVLSEVTTLGDVSIYFDKAMADPAGKQASFSVSVNGSPAVITSAQNTNTVGKIKLVLQTKISAGQTATVAYTQDADVTKQVKSADGGILASFAPQIIEPAIPGYVSSSTSTDGMKVFVTFDKIMADPSGQQAQFAVKVNNNDDLVTAAVLNAVNLKIIELTLTTPISYNQSVTVAYNAGNVAASTGTALASFSAQTVANTTQAVAPTFVSASTNTAGTIITVTFSKAMAALPAAPAGFTVTAGGVDDIVSAVALNADPTKIDLTLTTPVINGQAVTLNYTAGTVTAADSSVLASFSSAQNVTNNVLVAPTFVSASTNTAGTIITVTFSKAMAALSAAPAGFTVTVGGVEDIVSAVALNTDPTKIDITLTTPVINGQAVTLNYTAGTVTAADNSVLASFGSAQNVTNNVPSAPPSFVSATTNTVGKTVTLSFSKTMAALPAAPAGFTVTVNGVEATISGVALVSSDNTKINLTLTAAILNGQSVTVAYTAGTVTAADGTILASFAAQPVTNIVPVPAPAFVSAITNTTGETVTLTFSKAMVQPTSEAATGFTVMVAGTVAPFSAVSLNADPTKFDFTMTTPISYGSIVSIAYTPGTAPVTAVDTGVLGTRGAMNVTNTVPPTAATVNSAVTSGPMHIWLKMSSALWGTTGDPNAFTVSGATSNPNVTAVMVSGQNVILTLSTAVANGETIRVNYVKTGVNNLTNGTETASFSGQTVTNNIVASASAPTFDSAVTNLNGKVIIAKFDKAMAVLPTAPAGFTVSVDGVDDAVSAVALNTDPAKIELVLSRAVSNGQTVTLNYAAGTITADDAGLLATFNAQPVSNNTVAYGYIATAAGTYYPGLGSYAGDNVSAVDSTVRLYAPSGIAFDSSGNLYIADTSNNRVREVAAITHSQFGITMTAGNIYTVAGNGTAGGLGDGNIATSAQLNKPNGVAVDNAGNLYISDSSNNQIRKVDRNGVITHFAGGGTIGDGGPAFNANIVSPSDVAVDSVGNIYIADSANHRIRKVDTSGVITTVAGTGTNSYSGNGVPATSATLKYPSSLTVDESGNIYFVESDSCVAREIAATNHSQFGINMTAGYIYTIAGIGGSYGHTGDGGPATSAKLASPQGIEVDRSGNVYISELNGRYVRKVDINGIVTTIMGTGVGGYSPDNTLASSAIVMSPRQLAVDSSGNLYIAEGGNHIIRLVAMVQPEVAMPVASPSSGTVASGTTVTLSTGTTGTTIYYTMDGSIPTTASASGTSVTISGDPGSMVTVKAMAVKAGMTDSACATFVYTIAPYAPKVTGAVTSTDGSKIILTFDKAMADPSTNASQFTVNVNGTADTVTGAVLNTDPTKIELALSTAIVYGQSTTVNYIPGTVMAADSGVLAAFSGTAVENLVPNAITGIAVTTAPTKTAYIEGQSFDPAGMVVTATWNDGSTTAVTVYTVSPTVLTVGTTKVTVTSGSFTATTSVSVTAKIITGITVSTPPTKTAYIEGESFEPAGMVVTATWNNELTTTVTEYTVDPTVMTVGTTKVTVTSGSFTATTPVSVTAKTITGIAVTTPPTKTVYIDGQSFDPTGMVVTATYNDGTSAAVTGYTNSPSTLTLGITAVTVSYEGYNSSTPVTVNPAADTAAPTWPEGSALTAGNITQTSLTLNWNAAADNVGVTSYNVYRGTTLLGNVTGTTYNVNGLKAGTQYTFTVEAGDVAGNWSTTDPSVTVTTPAPTDTIAPTWSKGRLTASGITETSLILTWSGAKDNVGVTNYNLYKNGTLLVTVPANTSTYTVTELLAGTKYSFKVEAVDAAGNISTRGPSTTATTLDKQAPTWSSTTLTTDITSSRVTLTWSIATDNVAVTGYRIYKDGKLVATVSGSTTSYTVSRLKSKTTYTFTVRAGDAAGNWTTNGPSITVTTL